MTPETRIISLKVEVRVANTLAKFAAERNMSSERYALLLFEAAYAARCGFGQGDEALDAAIAAGHERSGAQAPASSPALAAAERSQFERRIQELKTELEQARSTAATRGAPADIRENDRVKAERDRDSRVAAAEDRAAELRKTVIQLTKDKERAQERSAAFVSELAKLKTEHAASATEIEAQRRRADEAEAALKRSPASIDPGELARKIAEMVQGSFEVMTADLRLVATRLEALTVAVAEQGAPPAAFETTAAPPVKRQKKFIWGGSWGR